MGTLLMNSAALCSRQKAYCRTVKIRSSQMSNDDVLLVKRARKGDLDAFRELVMRYQSRAQAIAFGVVGSREDAEDVVQEGFLKAYRNLSSFQGKSSFYTWFYRIVFNLAVDLSRKRYRRSESLVGDAAMLDVVAERSRDKTSTMISRVAGPDEELRRSELRDRIREAIENLSPEHRAVIVLREIEGLSYAEISDVVGCSKGTVMSRLHHARKRLQKALGEFFENSSADKPSEGVASLMKSRPEGM